MAAVASGTKWIATSPPGLSAASNVEDPRCTREPKVHYVISLPWIHDLVGLLSPSIDCIYVLTSKGRFGKLPVVAPFPKVTSGTVAQILLEHWVATLMCPAVATADHGSHFEGAIGTLLQSLGTKWTHPTAHHSAASGMVERFSQTAKNISLAGVKQCRGLPWLPQGRPGYNGRTHF